MQAKTKKPLSYTAKSLNYGVYASCHLLLVCHLTLRSAEQFGGTDPTMAEPLYQYGAMLVRVAQVSFCSHHFPIQCIYIFPTTLQSQSEFAGLAGQQAEGENGKPLANCPPSNSRLYRDQQGSQQRCCTHV